MEHSNKIATTTAGLRGTEWGPEALPSDVAMTAHPLKTADGAQVIGYLFRRGGERAVVCQMHPREMVVANYMIPELLEGGVAVWIQGPRSVGNDLRLEHESALLDLAAGQIFLRDTYGFEKFVLLGLSGGGPLTAMYAQQAGKAPNARIQHSPGGKPTKLAEATLPAPDGIVFLSTHPGQGKILLAAIDPSVVDESDPLKTDPSLSPFSPKNGFEKPPHSSSYSEEFLVRYRAAQAERVARIDAFALGCIERKMDARKRLKAGGTQQDAMEAAYSPIFEVWRTDADLRFFDLSLDRSERAYGSLWGPEPLVANFGSAGFARVCTPESWLSNWSANRSLASMEKCAPDIAQPVLMIDYTADNCAFPSDCDEIFAQIGSADKERHQVHGNHHGLSVDPDKPKGQKIAGEIVRDWLAAKRFN